jgi:hypothetical protein
MRYEIIQEIKNHCKNNQMRDVFFAEMELENPDEWIRQREPKAETIEREEIPGGIRYRVWVSGLPSEYNLTEID